MFITGRFVMVIIDDATVNGVTWSNHRPPLGIACLIETVNPLVLVLSVCAVVVLLLPLTILVIVVRVGDLQTSHGNPVLFGFRVEIRIKRAIVRHVHVAVAGREDLNHVRALHGVPSCIHEGLLVAINLLEEEIFVFRLSRGVCRKRRTAFIHTKVRSEGIVDDTTALCAICSNEVIGKSLPAGIEEVVILKGTIVRVVGTASRSNPNVGTPRNAVEFRTVTICTNRTRDMRAMGVIHVSNPIAVHVKGFAFCVVTISERITDSGHTRLIAVSGRAIHAGRMRSMETVAGEFRMLLKKSTGVHHGNCSVLTMVTQRISRRGIHGRQPPVLLILSSLPGLLGLFQLSRVLGDKAGIHVRSRGNAGTKHQRRHGERHGTLGSLGLGRMLFVCDDVLLMSHAPLGLENAIHDLLQIMVCLVLPLSK